MSQPELQIGVKALIPREDGFLFLVRSQPFFTEDIPTVDIPGGRIDLGEALIPGTSYTEEGTLIEDYGKSALGREIFQETGLVMLKNPEPQIIAVQKIIPSPTRWVVRLTFIAYTEEGNVALSDEHSGHFTAPLRKTLKNYHADASTRELAEILDRQNTLRNLYKRNLAQLGEMALL